MFFPKPIQYGGTLVGHSYLSLFMKCRRKWYFRFLHPVEGGEGIVPTTDAETLLQGSIVHEGMAAFYISGCKDGVDTGEYSLERALEAAEAHYLLRRAHFEDPATAEKVWAQSREMLTSYGEFYGPGGHKPDFPDVQVVCDAEGIPIIEREYTIDLGNGYVYTCRVDGIVQRYGFYTVAEHKTSAASWVTRRLESIGRDPQFTGEIFVLSRAHPEAAISGVWCNVLVKGRGQKSVFDAAVRETTDRTESQLLRFKDRVIWILKRIDESVDMWRALVTGGMSPLEAADLVFPEDGLYNEKCQDFNRKCEYLQFCLGIQHPSVALAGFRARTLEAKEVERCSDYSD